MKKYLGEEGTKQLVSLIKDEVSAVNTKICNKNLLQNWYFANPVNRQGKTTYTNTGYTIDRWRVANAGLTVSVHDGYIHLSRAEATGNKYFAQPVDMYESGKVFTFSALVSGENDIPVELGYTVSGNASSGGKVTLEKVWQLLSYTFTLPQADAKTFSVWFRPSADNNFGNQSVSIIAAKLELGPVQTLAHKEGNEWVLNEIPDYAEQYAICSQYDPITGAFVGSQHSNPNLLDNWYFVDPINQIGESEYTGTTNGSLSIDRWIVVRSNSKLTINADSISLAGGSLFAQEVRGLQFNEAYTFSILTKDGRLASLTISSLSTSTSSSSVIELGTLRLAYNTDYLTVQFTNGATAVELIAAKLERGSMQTLARQEGSVWVLNDAPPQKSLELLKCQRRFYAIPAYSNYGVPIGYGFCNSTTAARVVIDTPVAMDAISTIKSTVGSISLHADNSLYSPSLENISVLSTKGNKIYLNITGLTNLTTNSTCILRMVGLTGAAVYSYIAFSADKYD